MTGKARWSTLEEYLAARIREEDGHWIWTGPVQAQGQPQVCHRHSSTESAVRAMWLRDGRELPKGMLKVRCGVPLCVNPDHVGDPRKGCPRGHPHRGKFHTCPGCRREMREEAREGAQRNTQPPIRR